MISSSFIRTLLLAGNRTLLRSLSRARVENQEDRDSSLTWRGTGLGRISHVCCLSVCFILPSASVPLLLWHSIPVDHSPSTCQRSSHRGGQLSLGPNSK